MSSCSSITHASKQVLSNIGIISHALTTVQIEVPIQLHLEEFDMVVRPKDLLIADLHGVVCLPADLADKAVTLMERIVKADQTMERCIENGMSFTEASKHRAELTSVAL